MIGRTKTFIESEAASALPLLAAAVAALALANSPLNAAFNSLLHVEFGIAAAGLHKSIQHWINDGLMAVFFLLVGLEIKREVVDGELSRPSQIALPVAGALGGMAVPAAIYVAFNLRDGGALGGWAIPSATDIAFSLGVLAVLGGRVPLALKVFLTTLAIVDDLGAIAVIAAFYTSNLSALALGAAAVLIALLLALNLLGVRRLAPYLLLGVLLWLSVLKSGVHATLAGVALAMFIPLKDDGPAVWLEHALKPWSAWLIMPVFALANAGITLAGLSPAILLDPVPLGITAGLFVGKQMGILLAVGVPVALGWAAMPAGASWRTLYGVSILAGIGFTMSLFIGHLALTDAGHETQVRVGVLAGSLLSAVAGYLVLRLGPRRM
ncbi:MAG: Na+/H+ antiporter NhaA [Reyranellales bacterium]